MYKFEDVKEAYNESRKYSGEKGVAPFPPYVTFELTNICNYRCIMCQVAYAKRTKKELDFDLFKRAVDEISEYGSMVRFIGYEEPFLYSKISDAIRYVKEKGLLLHITTNGSLLNHSLIESVVEAKVDSVIFSFQGLTMEEYCFMRNTTSDTYRKVVNNIEMLYKSRKGGKPYIKITTTITERDNPPDKNTFINTHLKYTDEIQITGFTHFIHVDRLFERRDIWEKLKISEPSRVTGNVRCSVPRYEMIIKGDGGVYPCCGSFYEDLRIGNIEENTLYDIWHSGRAKEVREALGSGNLDVFRDCSVCPIRYEYEEIGNTVKNAREDKTEKFRKVT